MGVMAVWNLNFSVVVPPENEKYPWSVLYGDWSPRPAYRALQAMPK
jgi:L-amino acid N-acyltransferase YncA